MQEFETKQQWLVVVVVVSRICIVAVFACCSAAVTAAGAPHLSCCSSVCQGLRSADFQTDTSSRGRRDLVPCTQVCSTAAVVNIIIDMLTRK